MRREMDASNLPTVLLLLSLPLLLVAGSVAVCMTCFRGSARWKALAGLGLVLGVAGAWLGYDLVGPGRYAEFEGVQARLRAIPGVELVDARGHEDVTFEIEGFTVDVAGRGRIAFGALDRESFEHADHLVLESIGGREVIVVTEGFLGVYRADTGEPVRSTGWGCSR